jgi:hypothetical protein
VNPCTKRFRGNVLDLAAGAMTIRAFARLMLRSNAFSQALWTVRVLQTVAAFLN